MVKGAAASRVVENQANRNGRDQMHFPPQMSVALLVAFLLQVVISEGALAQGPEPQQGSKARVVLSDPTVAPFVGTVIETRGDGFDMDVEGESTPRRVDFADVESLQRAVRLGTRARMGALLGGATLAVTGFVVAYCVNVFGSGCARDLRTGSAGLLVGAGAGILIGGAIGSLITHYGPWETVSDLGAPDGSRALDRLRVDLLPYPDGRIGLGVTLALGGR